MLLSIAQVVKHDATLTLDPDAPGPLHARIAASARRLIADGRAAPGDRLPTARALATQLGVNMNTVLRAYRQLEAEQLVELRPGKGVTVLARADLARLHDLADELLDEARRLGVTRGELVALLISRDAGRSR